MHLPGGHHAGFEFDNIAISAHTAPSLPGPEIAGSSQRAAAMRPPHRHSSIFDQDETLRMSAPEGHTIVWLREETRSCAPRPSYKGSKPQPIPLTTQAGQDQVR